MLKSRRSVVSTRWVFSCPASQIRQAGVGQVDALVGVAPQQSRDFGEMQGFDLPENHTALMNPVQKPGAIRRVKEKAGFGNLQEASIQFHRVHIQRPADLAIRALSP